MQAKRAHPRYRTDIMLDFGAAESKVTGMTWDVSLGGMFVRTSKMPERLFQPPAALRGASPAGFAVTIKNGDSYRRFVDSVAAEAAIETAH